MIKALHGLASSGAHFHKQLSDALRNEGFKPALADADLWTREAGDVYEHVCVCVNDLSLTGLETDMFCNNLKEKHGYKLKGINRPNHHLSGSFGHETHGTLHWGDQTCVRKVLSTNERRNGSLPKKEDRPMDEDDHPKLNGSALLDAARTKEHQSLIGALQLCVTLSRINAMFSVMIASRFCMGPR